MRKILFGAAIVVLLIFTGVVMYQGTNGRLHIWGFTDIADENKTIDAKNAKLESLVTIAYPQSISKLNTSVETLQDAKKEYENQSILLAGSKYYKQTENYKNEFIFVKIGNYADANNVDLRIDVTNSDVVGLYDINFTLTGKYVDVASYIYDIENDSRLGFKIEDFIMQPANAVSVYKGSPNSSVTTYSRNDYVAPVETTTTENNATEENQTTNNQSGTTTTTKTRVNEVSANFNCKEISIDLKWLDENESIIPGIITRGNPYVDTMTTMTGKYANETIPEQQNNNANRNKSNSNNTENQNNEGNTNTNGNENSVENTNTSGNENNANNIKGSEESGGVEAEEMMREANAVNGNTVP